MPDWNSRLEVSVDGTPLVAVESVTPTYTTPVTPIHSIEADNIGALYHPQTATFTMTVKAIGASVLTLTQLAIAGTKFKIQLAEKTGTDWTFKKLLFRDCIITSVNPSNVVMDGVPVATVSGIILGFNASTDIEAP
jgi:hypothetical protein